MKTFYKALLGGIGLAVAARTIYVLATTPAPSAALRYDREFRDAIKDGTIYRFLAREGFDTAFLV